VFTDQFFVNDRLIGSGNNFVVTDIWQFNAECDEPTVYAVHAMDADAGPGDVAAFIADISHCGENFFTTDAWRCTAVNTPNMQAPPEQVYKQSAVVCDF